MASTPQRINASLLLLGKGDPIKDGVVIWEDKKIVFAGSQDDVPGDFKSLSAEKYPVIMPGMWDCHIHFMGTEILNFQTIALTSQALAGAKSVPDLYATVMAGFTSVREVAGYGVELAKAVASGKIVGPTIYGSHSAISMTGGHGDVHSMPLDGIHALSASGVPFTIADGIDECTKAVRKQVRKGARIIKVCASGGVSSELDDPSHQQFSVAELRAMVEEARRSGLAVAAHCHGKPGIMAALEAGCLTIEHGSYLDEEACDTMIEKGAILVATRSVIEALLTITKALDPRVASKLTQVADTHADAYKLAVRKGVKIALGTDTFTSTIKSNAYGMNGKELMYATNAGMTALQAIEAATANGPLTLGPAAPLSGQLKEGYNADFIAISRNPLDDIAILGDAANVTNIWKAGEMIKGQKLQ